MATSKKFSSLELQPANLPPSYIHSSQSQASAAQLSPGGYYGPPPGVGYAAPVVQQPGAMQSSMQQSSTTAIVVNQQGSQQPAPPTYRYWSTGICSCFDDCANCALVCFCWLCAEAMLSRDLGECCCTCCCVPNALTVMRTKMRMQLKIPGSICDDCCVVQCCRLCAICQMMREVKIARRQGISLSDS